MLSDPPGVETLLKALEENNQNLAKHYLKSYILNKKSQTKALLNLIDLPDFDQSNYSTKLLTTLRSLAEDNSLSNGQQLFIHLAAGLIQLGKLKEAKDLILHNTYPQKAITYLYLGASSRYLGKFAEAATYLNKSYMLAQKEQDGYIAIAALSAQGELHLDSKQAKLAVESFGKALGITELSTDSQLSAVPLAGLAHAQFLWGYAPKAKLIGQKALLRAKQIHKTQGRVLPMARATLSLGIIQNNTDYLLQAESYAKQIPHRPLALRCAVERMLLSKDSTIKMYYEQAVKLGMQYDARQLQKILHS